MTTTARVASPDRSVGWLQPGLLADARVLGSEQALLITESAEELAMTTMRIESVPQSWNDEEDTSFFIITARLFSVEFVYGASVLLASYDTDADTDAGSWVSSDALAAATISPRELAPATVRRTR
jgi:hypothetical protein